MKYYQHNGEVFAFETDGSQDAYIPAGAVRMTDPEVQAHLFPVPTVESVQARLSAAIQAHLDAAARARSYDSALSCVSYIDSTVTTYRAEATAMRDWRDAVWLRCYELLAEVQAGTRPIPTESELIALLPAIVWP
jgi:hypothetical protein